MHTNNARECLRTAPYKLTILHFQHRRMTEPHQALPRKCPLIAECLSLLPLAEQFLLHSSPQILSGL